MNYTADTETRSIRAAFALQKQIPALTKRKDVLAHLVQAEGLKPDISALNTTHILKFLVHEHTRGHPHILQQQQQNHETKPS